MKSRLLLLLVLLTPIAAVAQTASQRPLPPSMLAELRRAQKARTLVFRDTVRASDIQRAHINDSLERTYSDSAIAMMDTAVSLSHKEWLDSEIVEIPELMRLGSHVHFNYPASIMTESELAAVPFDSTIIAHMNPVTREFLPFFDQSPIPIPLAAPRNDEAYIELGGGNEYLPLLHGFAEHSFSDRTDIEGHAAFESHTSSAVRSFLDLGANFHASLGADPATQPMYSSELLANLGYTTKSVQLRMDSLGLTTELHRIGSFNTGVALTGDASEAFHYSGEASLTTWSEDLPKTPSTSALHAAATIEPEITNGLVLKAGGSYDQESLNIAQSNSANRLSLAIGNRAGAGFNWDAGAAMLGGSTGNSSFLPVAHVRIALNPRWNIGAAFDPRVTLSTMQSLTTTDPFYRDTNGRAIARDRSNLAGFMDYTLSPDDQLHLEARFVAHDSEAVFLSPTRVSLNATRRAQLVASGNFLFLTKDIVTAALTVQSATYSDSGVRMQFEPVVRFEAAYRLNSVSDVIRPIVEIQSLTLPDRSLGMINFELDVKFSSALGAKLRIENLLGGASDLWPGYEEYPRSIAASVKYSF